MIRTFSFPYVEATNLVDSCKSTAPVGVPLTANHGRRMLTYINFLNFVRFQIEDEHLSVLPSHSQKLAIIRKSEVTSTRRNDQVVMFKSGNLFKTIEVCYPNLMVPSCAVNLFLILTELATFNLFWMNFFDSVHHSHLAGWPKSDITGFVPSDKYWFGIADVHGVCRWGASENFFRLTWVNVPKPNCSVTTAGD